MLRRLLLLLAVAAVGYVAYIVRKRLLFDAAPTVPEGWSTLAEQEPRFQEVLDVRARLIKLIQRHQKGTERRRLMDDVHGCADAIADLVDRHQDLLLYIRDIQGAAAPKALHERAHRLDVELGDSLISYRQVYVDMLAALERNAGEETDAAEKTHELLEGLQRRAQAEREIAQSLRDTE